LKSKGTLDRIKRDYELIVDMIVNSVAYRAGGKVGDVTVDEISEAVSTPGTFVWVGLVQPDGELLRKMQEEFSLHDLAIEDALLAHQRPKIEAYGESIFIVVKTAQLVNGAVDYGETHLFAGSSFLLTVRHGASSSYAPLRARIEENSKLLSKGPGAALYAILDFVVDNYRSTADAYQSAFARLESSMFKSAFDDVAIEKVYNLRRDLLVLRNATLPVIDICGQLIRFHEEIVARDLRAYLRDVRDHAHQVINTIDSMHEMLTNAMHVNLALVTVRQNEVVKRLASWGAILVVPTIVFSLYGMNFEHMPELKSIWGYPVTLAVTALACGLVGWRFKRSGWL
jgi:magnesium transporter